jgi:hypothetical protein
MCGVNYFQIFNKKESDLWLGVTNLGNYQNHIFCNYWVMFYYVSYFVVNIVPYLIE